MMQPTNTQRVREVMQQAGGRISRIQIRDALKGVLDTKQTDGALSQLVTTGEIIAVGVEICTFYDSTGRHWEKACKFFKYVGQERPSKTILDAQSAATKLSRAKGIVQRMPTGLPKHYFTAPFREPSPELPYGFPPEFNWDHARGYVPPSAIALLQATLRRPMTREAA